MGTTNDGSEGSFIGLRPQNLKHTWRAYCESTNTLSHTAKLHKILSKDPGAKLGAIERPGGGFTSTPAETLQIMLDTHFPGSTRISHTAEFPETALDRRKPDYKLSRNVITYERVKWAMSTFSPFKTPAEDGSSRPFCRGAQRT